MAPPLPVRALARLGRTAVDRVTTMAPAQRNAFLRLIATAEKDEAVTAAVDAYLRIVPRTGRYDDPALRAAFEAADKALFAHLSGRTGPEIDLLIGELAQRRALVLETPEVLRKEFRDGVGALPKKLRRRLHHELDAGAAALQQRYFERIRLAASRAGDTMAGRATLMSGMDKLSTVLGGQWSDGWERAFAFARDHAADIARRARGAVAARAALDQAVASGSPSAVVAARDALRRAEQATGADLSHIKGYLNEAYAPLWAGWKLQKESLVEIAEREARGREGWTVRVATGQLYLGKDEVWDEAVLLVRPGGDRPAAELFMAAQFKVEKRLSAIKQILNDAARETASGANRRLPLLTVREPGRQPVHFSLQPRPTGAPAERYILNAAGTKILPRDVGRAKDAGVTIRQMNLDITVAEYDAVAREILQSVTDLVP